MAPAGSISVALRYRSRSWLGYLGTRAWNYGWLCLVRGRIRPKIHLRPACSPGGREVRVWSRQNSFGGFLSFWFGAFIGHPILPRPLLEACARARVPRHAVTPDGPLARSGVCERYLCVCGARNHDHTARCVRAPPLFRAERRRRSAVLVAVSGTSRRVRRRSRARRKNARASPRRPQQRAKRVAVELTAMTTTRWPRARRARRPTVA